jgi:hypothetical protein
VKDRVAGDAKSTIPESAIGIATAIMKARQRR